MRFSNKIRYYVAFYMITPLALFLGLLSGNYDKVAKQIFEFKRDLKFNSRQEVIEIMFKLMNYSNKEIYSTLNPYMVTATRYEEEI